MQAIGLKEDLQHKASLSQNENDSNLLEDELSRPVHYSSRHDDHNEYKD